MPTSTKTLKRFENILTATDHDFLVEVRSDLKWLKIGMWGLYILLGVVEGLKLAGVPL